VRTVATLLAVAATAVGVGVGSPAAGTRTPTLRIVGLAPVTVQGLRFGANERVRVVLTAERRSVRYTRASRSGAFVVRFALQAKACTAFNLRATGASGAGAAVTRKLPRQCAALDPTPP
jgi:hypothetical protein